MARIQLPVVSRQVGPSQQFQAPGVAPVQDFTGRQVQALGEAVGQAGRQVSALAADLQTEYDAAKVLQGELAVDKVLDEEVGGYLGQIGEAATGDARKEAQDRAQKRIDAILSAPMTDAQRTLLQRATAPRVQEWNQRAVRHENTQTRHFAYGMKVAAADNALESALASIGTPQFLQHKAQMLAHVTDAARLQGLSQPEIERAQRGATTRLHSVMVQNLVQRGYASAARDYLEGAKGEVDAENLPRLQGLVQRATDDDRAFQAARWSRQQGGNLLEQIERLDQFTEGGHLSVGARNAAVAQLRAAESDEYQTNVRVRNEVLDEVQAFARANRVRSYAQLPPEMRQRLEETGRNLHVEAWLEAGQQNVTTREGLELLMQASPAFLAAVSRDELRAAATDTLSDSDAQALLAEKDRVDGHIATAQAKANELPDALVNMTVTRRMMELGYLTPGEAPSEAEKVRRDWVLERVKRDIRAMPNKSADEIIEAVLGETLKVNAAGWEGAKVMPMDWWTPKERETGVYETPLGDVQRRQVAPTLVEQRLLENRARNAAIREWNRQAVATEQRSLLPEDTPSIVASLTVEADARKRRRETAYVSAQQHLRQARRAQGIDAWHSMPDALRAELRATGMEEHARVWWQSYLQTHDWLGRRNQPDGPMQQAFGSPWSR